MWLSKMKMQEIQKEIDKGTVVILPVGSTEEHGPHLPVDTDIAIPVYIAEKAAQNTGSIVAPPVNYGYNEREKVFAGTVSVRTFTFYNFVFDICSSLSSQGFKKILLINGHGTNAFLIGQLTYELNRLTSSIIASINYVDIIQDVIEKIRDSKRGESSHGAEIETSIMLYIDPENVDRENLVKDLTRKKMESKYVYWDIIRTGPVFVSFNPWNKYYTKTGVVGDATRASREKGEKFVETAVERVSEFIETFRKDYNL